jgi:translocation and assembly module TamB
MKKRLAFLIVMLFVLIIPAGLFGLISNGAGSHWLLRKVFLVLPGKISVAAIQGRLIDRVSLTDFHYQSGSETVVINNLVFAWKPYELFSGTLKIVDVEVNI